LYAEFSRIGQAEPGYRHPAAECTAFAVLPEASSDGHLRIGQNWDWIPDVAGALVHTTQPDGLRVLCFTEAGIAGGKIGANSAGLGLAVNGLVSSDDDWARLGRPFHARTWEILTCARLDGALEAAQKGERSCSANFVIAQAGLPGEGRAVDVEAAPRASLLLHPRSGLLAHANHFLNPDQLGIRQPLREERTSTFQRCGRMEQMLTEAAAAGPIGPAALQAMLRDHDGMPESVCRHPNLHLPESERYQSVVSMIMDLHAGRILAAVGPPCTHPFVEYAV
jgi:isopenicillin-N N-acyltransferase-like protein